MPPQQKAGPPGPGAQDRLRLAVQSLFRSEMRRVREAANREGLTMAQVFVLRRVHRAGTIPATSWAREEGVTASSLSSVVDGLVGDGYLKRSRETADRRVVHLALTPKGARLTDRLESEQMEHWKESTRSIDPKEIRQAAEILERIGTRNGEGAAPDPGPAPRPQGRRTA